MNIYEYIDLIKDESKESLIISIVQNILDSDIINEISVGINKDSLMELEDMGETGITGKLQKEMKFKFKL